MADNRWVLPLKRVGAAKKVDRSVVWNTSYISYEQSYFGSINTIEYGNSGRLLAVAATNQEALLRLPHSGGAVWNEQSVRSTGAIRFRHDDKLVVKAVDQRVIVRSTETNFERYVEGHTLAVRDVLFLSNQVVASCSDDLSVRLWDVMGQAALASNTDQHTDYVRCLAGYDTTSFFSGSYDHTVVLWDARDALVKQLSLPVEGPVEHVECIPGGYHLVASAKDLVYFFDLRKTGDGPLLRTSHHTKTVTSLAYSAQHQTLLTGSLDGRLHFLSCDSRSFGTVVATRKFKDPITAAGVAPDGTEYTVGFATGLLQSMTLEGYAPGVRKLDGGRGIEVALTAEQREEVSLQKFMLAIRIALSKYKYQRALRTALLSRKPDVIVSTLEELLRRGALRVALANQNDRTVVAMLRAATRLVGQPAFTDLALTTVDIIIEIYSGVASTSPYLRKQILMSLRHFDDIMKNLNAIEDTVAIMEMIIEA